MIDWKQILTKYHIEYVDRGPSTAKGNVYVRCPWCGQADQGFHMGISLHGHGWGCWRDARHRGKSGPKLLARLLGVSYEEAASRLGVSGTDLPSDQDLLGTLLRAMSPSTQVTAKPAKLNFPTSFKRFKFINGQPQGQANLFVDYLVDRSYAITQVEWLTQRYRLRYCMNGLFAYRVIIPVYDAEENLITWTARTISSDPNKVRYMTLTTQEDAAKQYGMTPAIEPISNMLLNEPGLLSGELLLVVEGAFDAFKINCVTDADATCLFGKAISDKQTDKLFDLADRYEKKVLLLDRDAALDGFATVERLRPVGFVSVVLPKPWKDPDSMPDRELKKFVESLK